MQHSRGLWNISNWDILMYVFSPEPSTAAAGVCLTPEYVRLQLPHMVVVVVVVTGVGRRQRRRHHHPQATHALPHPVERPGIRGCTGCRPNAGVTRVAGTSCRSGKQERFVILMEYLHR